MKATEDRGQRTWLPRPAASPHVCPHAEWRRYDFTQIFLPIIFLPKIQISAFSGSSSFSGFLGPHHPGPPRSHERAYEENTQS